jgi:hypothetical protein
MNLLKTAFTVLFLIAFTAPAFAEVAGDQADYERRHELAEKMQELRPAREQVDSAVDQYVMQMPADQRESYRTALRSMLNYKALEKISVDAYAEVYTAQELQTMVEYFSKPEAQSASDKIDKYANIVYPEIVRMLDKAMMRAKTGSGVP